MFKDIRPMPALLLLIALAGCGPTQPLIITKHVLVAQDDSDLVDCQIDPPPAKLEYLNTQGPVKEQTQVEILTAALKVAEKREKALGDAWMSQTTNLVKCNVRWKGSREFKVKTTERIKALENEKGK